MQNFIQIIGTFLWQLQKSQNTARLTVCFYHATYAFQGDSTLYSCLNVKKLRAQSRRIIWSLTDCNWTRTQNHLGSKRTINHLAKLNIKNSAFSYWYILLFTHLNLACYWINTKMWASSKHNSDLPVFPNRNIRYSSIVYILNVKFFMILGLFIFVKIHNSTKHLSIFCGGKMIKTCLARYNHKIVDSVQVLSSSKVWVEYLVVRDSNTKVFIFSPKLNCFIHF